MCHLLLILPLLALPVFWFLSLPVAVVVYVLVTLFSAWVYYALMRSMRQRPSGGREGLVHATGEVVEAAGGRARVRVLGEIWSARYRGELAPGDRVEVVAVEGLRLRVQRADTAPAGAGPEGGLQPR